MRPVSFWTGALLLAAAEAYVPVGRTSLQHADLDRAEADAEASASPPQSGRGGLEVALGFGAGCAAAALSRRRVLSLSSLSLSLPLQARALGRSEEKSGDLQKVDINNASSIEYRQFKGLYPTGAAIIAGNGPYNKIEDVYNLPGIRNDEMMKEPLCDAVAMHVIFSGDAVELQRSLRLTMDAPLSRNAQSVGQQWDGQTQTGNVEEKACDRCDRRTPYLHCMASQLLKAQAKRVLVLGLGGGLLPQALSSFGMEVVAVESSSVVLDLSQRFFGLEDRGVELVHADAEEFVRSTGRLDFDACAIDIFQGHSSSTPAFTRSVEFLRILENSLRPGACVLQNAIDATGAFCASRGAIPRSRGRAVRCTARRRDAAPRGPPGGSVDASWWF
ncbi:unnamed protein product [Effrenium voratum]|uniref:Photosystem II 12 kDa extrinsic protein n=1 Tax=Effrenium voratum TaxID=2562239 RepID=A0AA36J163_9DINO|nr:unnamed protein product [Effrenium voratum]